MKENYSRLRSRTLVDAELDHHAQQRVGQVWRHVIGDETGGDISAGREVQLHQRRATARDDGGQPAGEGERRRPWVGEPGQDVGLVLSRGELEEGNLVDVLLV